MLCAPHSMAPQVGSSVYRPCVGDVVTASPVHGEQVRLRRRTTFATASGSSGNATLYIDALEASR